MAQCILCKANIRDGTQYCETCYSKVKSKADESYLDLLLSSVTSSDDNSKNVNRKVLKARQEHKEEKRKNMSDDIIDGVPSDYNIFSKSDDDSDMDFLNGLFNQAIADTTSDGDHKKTTLETDIDTLPEIAVTKEPTIEDITIPEPSIEASPDEDSIMEDSIIPEPFMEEFPKEEPIMEDFVIPEPFMEEFHKEEPIMEDLAIPEPSIEELIFNEAEFDPTVDISSVGETSVNLMKELDFELSKSNQWEEEEENNSLDDLSDNDRDILDLINEISNSEELPPIEDVTNYGDQLGNDYRTEQELERKSNTDIGDVFSDALSAVSSLQDIEDISVVSDDLMGMIPDIGNNDTPPAKENKEKQSPQKSKKKKVAFFSRIFGNIKEERTEEEREQLVQKAIEEKEKKEAEKKAKEQEEKEKKELTKAAKAENAQKAKEENKKKKQEKEKKAKEKKEAKDRRSREIQELIDEIDENDGKINKVGAGIIFAFFAALAVLIVVGTSMYTYSLAIKHAKDNFEIQHYNEAYKNVYGIEIKDEDIEIYDKIMTVMFVNKQLNSYENYYNMKRYPEALDSLLKGLERYDKYYSLAGLLGIESDLDYVRSEILEKLNMTFDVSEEEANVLLSYDDQIKYSEAIYELLSDRTIVSADDN